MKQDCKDKQLGYYCYDSEYFLYCDGNGYGTNYKCKTNTQCKCGYTWNDPCVHNYQQI